MPHAKIYNHNAISYHHFTAKAFCGNLGRLKHLNLSVIEQKPSVLKLTNRIAAFLDEAIVMTAICCSSVHGDSHQIVPAQQNGML